MLMWRPLSLIRKPKCNCSVGASQRLCFVGPASPRLNAFLHWYSIIALFMSPNNFMRFVFKGNQPLWDVAHSCCQMLDWCHRCHGNRFASPAMTRTDSTPAGPRQPALRSRSGAVVCRPLTVFKDEPCSLISTRCFTVQEETMYRYFCMEGCFPFLSFFCY